MIVVDEYDVDNLIKQSLQRNALKVSVFTDPIPALEDFKLIARPTALSCLTLGCQG
jgi:hypothetical protein